MSIYIITTVVKECRGIKIDVMEVGLIWKTIICLCIDLLYHVPLIHSQFPVQKLLLYLLYLVYITNLRMK